MENVNKSLISNSDSNPNNTIKVQPFKRKFDLNEHLFNYLEKINFDEKDLEKQNYCITCKVFTKGEDQLHISHDIIDSTKDLQNINYIADVFENLETKYFNNFTDDVSTYTNFFNNQIQSSIEKLVKILNNFKAAKMEDVENLKESHKKNFEKMKKNFFEMKFKFNQFYLKNDYFLNFSKTNNPNNNINNSALLNNSVNGVYNGTYSNGIFNNQIYMNSTNLSLNYVNAKHNKYSGKDILMTKDKILNDVFFLVNLDLNRQIEFAEKNIENYLELEKSKVLNQANQLERIFNEFANQVTALREKKFSDYLPNQQGEKEYFWKLPDFTQSLNLRLRKYTDIFDKLNYTLIDVSNPNSFKHVESTVDNLENEIISKLKNKSIRRNSNQQEKVIFSDIFNELNSLEEKNNEESDSKKKLYENFDENSYIAKLLSSKYAKLQNSPQKKAEANLEKLNEIIPLSLQENIMKKKIDFNKITINEIKKNDFDRRLSINSNKSPSKSPAKKNSLNTKKNTLYMKNYLDLKKTFIQKEINNIKSISDKKEIFGFKVNNFNNSTFSCLDENNYKSNNSKFRHSSTGVESKNSYRKYDSLDLKSSNNPFINSLDLNNIKNLKSINESIEVNMNNSMINKETVLNTSILMQNVPFWRDREDLVKRYLVLTLIASMEDINEIEDNSENNSKCERILKENYLHNFSDSIVAKIIEKTNEIHIYDKKSITLTKNKLNLNKDLHGIDNFLHGSRYVIANDKLFIIGGRDLYKEYSVCLEYDYKLNYIKKIPSMKNPRSYHSLIFNYHLMKIFAIGGENNKTCEAYDLYQETWTDLPDLHIPRSYMNCYINKANNLLYGFFGQKGEITKKNYSDAVEILNLEKKNLGWKKIEYSNKTDMDLKTRYVQVFPIENDKLLIVGNNLTRHNYKNFAVYDLKIDNIAKIDDKLIMEIGKKVDIDPTMRLLLCDMKDSIGK